MSLESIAPAPAPPDGLKAHQARAAELVNQVRRGGGNPEIAAELHQLRLKILNPSAAPDALAKIQEMGRPASHQSPSPLVETPTHGQVQIA